MDNAVEGGAQQSVIALFHFLIVNFTQQFIESNLAGYLVENIRDNDPFFIRARWTEWTRMLMEQVLAYSTQNQPLFPDPTEIPLSRLTPREVAEALLRYFDGFARNKDQSAIDALRRYLGEQQPQAQAQPQAEAQGQAGMNLVPSNVDDFIRRYANVPPTGYTNDAIDKGVQIAIDMFNDVRRAGVVRSPYDDSTYDIFKAVDAFSRFQAGRSVPGSMGSDLVNILNQFVLAYGDSLNATTGGLDYLEFIDLLIRMLQFRMNPVRPRPRP
jgi:hypothetical protein